MSDSDKEQRSTDQDAILGIDLGTTNSLVAIADSAGARVLGDADHEIMPSVVRVDPDGSVHIGEDAFDRMVEFPERTINSVKRLMGRSREDAQDDLPFLGYEVIEGQHQTARVRIETDAGEMVYSPQEISAIILSELKRRAQAALGHEVRRAVVTVPAYFDDAQRQATRDAGRLAGLEVVRIINEPTAAALAYGIGTRREGKPQTIAVYDLGGGTFDISVLRLVPGKSAGEPDFFQVLSTAGDTHLGGDDVDHLLVELFVTEIAGLLGFDDDSPMDRFDVSTRRALVGFARGVKHRLSNEESAQIQIDLGGGNQYERTITRREFESMIDPWVGRSLDACRRAMRDARRSNGNELIEIDSVVMVGGSTRIGLVRERVGAFFGVEPYTALDPDRVVALGASMQGLILSDAKRETKPGEGSSSLLIDVIPLSLGIETAGGAMAKLIMRNTSVPARAVERFSTSVDGQVNVKIHVVQGEREMAEDCRSLGVFDLRGIPPMPAGVPKLVVEFLVDANGVLRVSAIEERSGKRAQIQIIPNHGLSREEVERIEQESFTHAREDMDRHRVVDLITNSKLDIKWISERLERYGAMLDSQEHRSLSDAIETLGGFVSRAEADWKSVDPNAFYQAKDTLDRSSVRLQEIGISQSLRDDQAEQSQASTPDNG